MSSAFRQSLEWKLLKCRKRRYPVVRSVAESLGISVSRLEEYRKWIHSSQQQNVIITPELTTWSRNNGVLVSPNVQFIRNDKSGYGLYVKHPVCKGHIVLSIPVVITYDSFAGGGSDVEQMFDVARQLWSKDNAYSHVIKSQPVPNNAIMNPRMDESLESPEGKELYETISRTRKEQPDIPNWALAHAISRVHQALITQTFSTNSEITSDKTQPFNKRRRPHRSVSSVESTIMRLHPILDFVNHHNSASMPTCHYEVVPGNGASVVDNVIAGVPDPIANQPYLHLCTSRDVHVGEELSYLYCEFDGDIAEDRDLFRIFGGFELAREKSVGIDDVMQKVAAAVEHYLQTCV
eukprot:PhF_6_TR13260/c0_g1_i1/m.21030